MNELIRQLDSINKGANVHTINKAAYYLGVLNKKGQSDPPLVGKVQAALVSDDWREVKELMARWW